MLIFRKAPEALKGKKFELAIAVVRLPRPLLHGISPLHNVPAGRHEYEFVLPISLLDVFGCVQSQVVSPYLVLLATHLAMAAPWW